MVEKNTENKVNNELSPLAVDQINHQLKDIQYMVTEMHREIKRHGVQDKRIDHALKLIDILAKDIQITITFGESKEYLNGSSLIEENEKALKVRSYTQGL